jgi:hypothetical protein
MDAQKWSAACGACMLVLVGFVATPALAQITEVKEKPPMYTYVSDWVIPRAQWGELDKSRVGAGKIFEKAGDSLVGYGDDLNLIHTADGNTHDSWWSSMSMGGILTVLEEFHKAAPSPVLNSASKHWDNIYLSRYYNWHKGSAHSVYTHTSSYKLKADAPSDALDTLCQSFIVPTLEKLLADGTLIEYEIDEEAEHTQAPNTFWIVTIGANAQAEDKIRAAIRETFKGNPLIGPTFNSVVDFDAHRDNLALTNATYK